MATTTNKCFGFEFQVVTPGTVEEFDKAAGKPGAALAEAVKNVLYRSWNNTFRYDFAVAVEKETGVKWPVDEKKTNAQKDRADGKEKTPILITEGDYFDLVLASGFKREQFGQLAVDIAAKIPFDPSESARGGGRIGKEFLEAAAGMLAETDKLEKRIKRLQELNPGLIVALDGTDAETGEATNAPSIETLAKAIKVNADRKLREAIADPDLA